MSSCDTEQAAVVSHNCATELWDIALEVHKILGLLSSVNIIEVDILVSPLEIVDDSLIC